MMLNVKKLKNVLNTLNKTIRLSGIIEESIVDGPGLRYVIFTQGCYKRCFMCHNANTQDLKGGYIKELDQLVSDFTKNPIIRGITISGGEPFIQPEACSYLVEKAILSGLDVVIYSGYYYEELKASKNKYIHYILENATYLIDGPFEYDKKNLNILFRGSTNQRIINLKETKKLNKLVIYDSESGDDL